MQPLNQFRINLDGLYSSRHYVCLPKYIINSVFRCQPIYKPEVSIINIFNDAVRFVSLCMSNNRCLNVPTYIVIVCTIRT